MSPEQVHPQAAPLSGLDKMAEGLLGRLVMGDIPDGEKADILVDLTAEMRLLRVATAQQTVALVSMQNILAIWNNCLLAWTNDEKGRAFKAIMRELSADGLTGNVEPIELDSEIAEMVEELSAEMDADDSEPDGDGGGGEEPPVIDAEFREVSRKSGEHA